MTEENKITKDMSFGEVLRKYPQTVKTFFMYGMHCFGCAIAEDETIEQGALAHGVSPDELVDELNKSISGEVKKEDEQQPEAH
jgi:hybrid cluster-associated redox disulfide protein